MLVMSLNAVKASNNELFMSVCDPSKFANDYVVLWKRDIHRYRLNSSRKICGNHACRNNGVRESRFGIPDTTFVWIWQCGIIVCKVVWNSIHWYVRVVKTQKCKVFSVWGVPKTS